MFRLLRAWSLFLIVILGILSAVRAQTVRPDSSSNTGSEAVYFEIAKDRIVLWMKANLDVYGKATLEPILQLVEDARDFASEGDYDTAFLLLDTASDIIQDMETEKQAKGNTPSGKPAPEPDLPTVPKSQWIWEPQIITGMDLWRQEFELGFASGLDSTMLDAANNPFWGIRLRGNYERGQKGYFELYSTAKLSRDYYSGELQFRHLSGDLQKGHFLIDNRFEITRYRRALSLQFWENRTLLQGGIPLAGHFVILAGNDFRLRQYWQANNLYPNYVQNQVYGGGQFTSGLASRLSAMYSYAVRKHPFSRADDFVEHRVDASAYQITAVNSSIYIENIWRQRLYLNGDSDSTYQNSYSEEFLRADLRFGLNPWLSFDFQGSFTLRQHRLKSTITPDFIDLRANPRFLLRIWGDWQVGVGYLYILRVHSKKIIQKAPVLSATPADAYISYEDYYSHGLSVSLELFRLGAFMLSLTNQLEYRTYPGSPTKSVPGFGLFTDRKINSLLMFLSWQIFSGLELNIIANLDNDISRVENHSDTRSQIISFDLGYSF